MALFAQTGGLCLVKYFLSQGEDGLAQLALMTQSGLLYPLQTIPFFVMYEQLSRKRALEAPAR